MQNLQVVQDKFKAGYDIDWYENWFYNQSTGLLTFNTGDVELNFRYFDIGSFSTKSNTWKWSWDNDSILDSIKEQVDIVRDFGEKHNYTKLTTGYFGSDEFDAWEFAGIAITLTDAIGVYRPVSANNLQHFLIVTEFVDIETAKKIKSKYIECANHEYRRIAFVCSHLTHNKKVGFNEAFDTVEDMELDEDDDLQAWCDACEKIRAREDGCNDASTAAADVKLVCEKCYFEMKELNLGYT